jgi:uncharacterized membrane protein HdeD (DUF308 family)
MGHGHLGRFEHLMGVILVSAPLFAAVWLVIVLGVASLVGGIASVCMPFLSQESKPKISFLINFNL